MARQQLRAQAERLDPELIDRWVDEVNDACETNDDPPSQTQRTKWCLWLAAYEASFDPAYACAVAGITRWSLSSWSGHPAWKQLRAHADDVIAARVQGEVWRRAVDGVEKPVWFRGQKVGSETVYSDQLLIRLAERVAPSTWRPDRTDSAPTDDRQTAKLVAKVLGDAVALSHARALAAALSGEQTVIDVDPLLPSEVRPLSDPE